MQHSARFPCDRSPLPVDLPTLEGLRERIHASLARKGQVGLLSVTVLQRRPGEPLTGWAEYDRALREISAFLGTYQTRSMRRSDGLVEASINGNAFVLVLDPPRQGRPLEIGDVRRVRRRVRRAIRNHLAHALPRNVRDDFGCYVGGALLRHEPRVLLERIINRGLEEAFADAFREKEREGERDLHHLRLILDRELVHSVYQPVVDIVDRKIIGYEALTRVPPARFPSPDLMFKTALQNDFLWTLERLCRRKALEDLPALSPKQLLFLNIEADSIHDPNLRETSFLRDLGAVGLSPERIVLELTEHSAVRDYAAFRRTLGHFRDLGFRLAMDDVGSGYSGLQAIAEIAPDFIKADMALIRGIHRNALKRELISTIARFSESTGITLVAEGVETPEELICLVRLGVRCAQGFLLARPDTPPGVPDWSTLPATGG